MRTLQSQDGGINPAYFAHIRKLSIDYWRDLDRKKMFDELIEQVDLEGLEK